MKQIYFIAALSAAYLSPALPATAASGPIPLLKGSVLSSQAWDEDNPAQGIYRIPAAHDEKFEILTPLSFGTAGTFGNFVQGDYYFSSERIRLEDGYFVSHLVCDANTGRLINTFSSQDCSQVAIDCAVDPVSGLTYAATYDKAGNGYQLSVLTFTQTTADSRRIGDFDCEIAALGCDSKGQLWAITRDRDASSTVTGARLLKVNKQDASYSTVGDTGCLPHYLSSATIDKDSDRMFWTVNAPDESGALYEVSLNDGHATQVYLFPDAEQVVGLVSAGPAAQPKAPAKPLNLKAEFPEGSLSGNVTADIPATTFDGEPASGNVSYSLSRDGREVASGNVAVGTLLSIPVSVPSTGLHTFTLQTSNSAGLSPKTSVDRYVGFGTPSAPADVKATYSDGFIHLVWTPVTTSADGGYIDRKNVTYSVTRADGTVAASGLSGTSYTEAFTEPSAPVCLRYSVRAFNNGSMSDIAYSNTLALGTAAVPFFTNFLNDKSSLDGYTVVDANDDGRTWIWDTKVRNGVRAPYNTDHITPMDDWLISPAIDLKAGAVYSLRVRLGITQTDCPETFEVKFGTDNTPEGMVDGLIAPTVVTEVTPQDYHAVITPQADGRYFVGIHCISEPDKYYLFIDELSVTDGLDLPKAPAAVNIRETEKPGQVYVEWEPVSEDLNGKPLGDNVSYDVYKFDAEFYEWNLYRTGLTENSLTVDWVSPEEEQDFAAFAIRAVSPAGEGERTVSDKIPVGTPYESIKESFSWVSMHNLWLLGGDYERNTVFSDNTIKSCSSFDGDNGYLAMRCNQEKSAFIQSGKLSLRNTVNPGISFYTYNLVSAQKDLDTNLIEVGVRRSGEETEFKTVLSCTVAELAEFSATPGWVRGYVPLTDFIDDDIEFRITGTVLSFNYVMLDNIQAGDMIDFDLALQDVAVPIYAFNGTDYTVTAKVMNRGSEDASGWTADLIENGKVVQTISGNTLGSDEAQEISFSHTVSALATDSFNVKVIVNLPDDRDMANNESDTYSVTPVANRNPMPSGLAAASGSEGVALGWTAPELSDEATVMTEGFEDAADFAHILSEWQLIDVDGECVGGFNEFVIPGIVNNYTPSSFFIFTPAELGLGTQFAPHSGDKFLAALLRWDLGAIDDWAISPLLSGDAQKVSLYARSFAASSPEKVEILYSTGSTDPRDFKTALPAQELPQDWTLLEADLPEGARRFAIRACSENGFMLLVDDVTFQAAPASERFALKGYNLYRNGQPLNSEPISGTSYADATGDADCKYRVTALYAQGESMPTAEVTPTVSGITSAEAGIGSTPVYFNLQGIRVPNPTPGIYIRVLEGKAEQVIIK